MIYLVVILFFHKIMTESTKQKIKKENFENNRINVGV